jgi:hypothetical protein
MSPCLFEPSRLEADGPPRIWGVEMLSAPTSLVAWRLSVSRFSIEIRMRPDGGFMPYVSGLGEGVYPTPTEAALAIEAELTRIESEIRAAREAASQ